jgi:hypothetical protein
LEELHGGGVSKYVRAEPFLVERWTLLAGGGGVGGDETFDGVSAEPTAGAGGEQLFVWLAGPFSHPGIEHCFGDCGERDRSLLAAFTGAANVRPGAEGHVGAVESGDLGDTQSGLDSEQEQRTVSSAFPTATVGSGDQSVDLSGGQK